MILRPAHLSDLPEVYEICHRTGHVGQDASDVVGDRRLLGHYFAGPYLVRDVRWCWVASDDEGVAGYLVTTPDSPGFAEWMNTDWLPGVRQKVAPASGGSFTEFEAWLRTIIHEPVSVPDFASDYPGHFHIDFLPRAQGQGLGTRVLRLFDDQARASGLAGYHLGVGVDNLRAQKFYAREGFQVIREEPGVIYLGKRM